MKGRRRAAGVVALVAVACVGACLDDLPDPTACDAPARVIDDVCVPCDPPKQFVGDTCMICPPAAEVPYTQCLPNAFTSHGIPPDGCAAGDDHYERYACLTGDRACKCDDAAPADAEPTCFAAAEDCPAAVLEAAPNAICLPLAEEDIHMANSGALSEGCTCGCPSLMARCDGKGLAFGSYSSGMNPMDLAFDVAQIELGDRLPASGFLGVYVRARGIAFPFIVAPFPTSNNLNWAFYITNDFAEQVAYSPEEEGIDISVFNTGIPAPPYHFESDADRPTLLYVGTPAILANTGLLTMYEIDCVIPFVVPD